MSRRIASVSQGRICSDNCTCCHTETEVTDPTFYLTQSQYTDTEPTSASTGTITPGAWQGSQWSGNCQVTGVAGPDNFSMGGGGWGGGEAGIEPNTGAAAVRRTSLPLGQGHGGMQVKCVA